MLFAHLKCGEMLYLLYAMKADLILNNSTRNYSHSSFHRHIEQLHAPAIMIRLEQLLQYLNELRAEYKIS
jgi:hypothetical protein